MADLTKILPSQLMQGVLGKLYEVLTQGDETVPASKDNFLSWCSPGIPVTEEDFEFVKQGFTGVIKPPVEGEQKEITPEEKQELKATHTGQLYMQAEAFARMIDFVPDVNAGTNGGLSRLSIQQNEGTLSDVYKYALNFSKVANTELSEEDKKKIDKFRELLSVKRKKKDLITDEEIEVVEASPLVVLYNEKMQAYMDAVLEYNARRIDALSATNSAAIHFWAMNAGVLRNKVKAVLNDWITNGYKNEYEGIAARIDQIMSKDLSLLKAEYKDTLERAKVTGIASGSDFYYTTLAPANFTKGGWTKFTFASHEFNSHANSSRTSYGAKASAGFFGIGASAGHQRTSSSSESAFDATGFSLAFEMCQVPIIRPWFKTPFLTSKAWKLDHGNPEVQSKGEVLSDGNMPPDGIMPGYPTAIIFVRNLRLNFGNATGSMSANFNSNSTEASAGWGPFSVKGNYAHQDSHREQHAKSDNQGITVEGMQIIGFNCHVLPKSPNPLPNITNWI